jgi:protoporphyrinogen oxidase
LLLERAPRLRAFNALLFPASAGIGLVALDAEHHKPGFAPPGAALFRAQLARADADRLWHAADAELVDFVSRELARTPIGRLRPQAHAIARSDAINPIFYPGYLARRIRFERRIDRSPRLFFAGDYLVGTGIEAALTSGLRAADEIAATRAPRSARAPRLRGSGDVAL